MENPFYTLPVDFNKGIVFIAEVVFYCFSDLIFSDRTCSGVELIVRAKSQHFFEQSLELVSVVSCKCVHVLEDMTTHCTIHIYVIDKIRVILSSKDHCICQFRGQIIVAVDSLLNFYCGSILDCSCCDECDCEF